jgi:hypothetical protein
MEPNREIPSDDLRRVRIAEIESATPLGFPGAAQNHLALRDRPAEGSSADNIHNRKTAHPRST